MAKLQIDDNALISLVQENSSLYDRNSSQYKDAVLKDHAWTSISKALNLPKVVCKSRWTIIRQRYSRVKRQLGQPSRKYAEGARRTSAWRLYENLHFLNGHILPRCCGKRISGVVDSNNFGMKQERAEETRQESGDVKPDVFQFGLAENQNEGGEVKFKVEGEVASCTRNSEANNERKATSTTAVVKTSDVSFGEFIAFELASFKTELNKDAAKQNIVNVIYKYKNRA